MVNIKVFAVLKDYFDENFSIDQGVNTVEDLKKELIERKPHSRNLLASCRFAINNSFVDTDFKLNQNDTIYIIPPSSGG